MELKIEKCPKCGFTLTNNKLCAKCGYVKGMFMQDMTKYNSIESDLDLFLKEKWEKYIYNENNLLIFLLGPLFFSYSGFFWIGMILTFISFRIGFLIYYNLGLIIFLSCFLFVRFLYMTFLNTIVLWLINLKISLLKKHYVDYKIKIEKIKPTSVIYVVLAFIMAISLSIIFFL